MKKTTFIYSLSDPISGHVRYIGKSNNPKQRFTNGHMVCIHHKDKKSKKRSWIKSLVDDGKKPKLDIIDEVDVSDWAFWERHYISLFKSWGFKLTNTTDGGEGGSGCSWNKGKKHTQETINKIKERRRCQKSTKGWKMTEKNLNKARETLNVLHLKRIGQKDSEYTKVKRGNSISVSLKKSYSSGKIIPWNKGRKMSEDFKTKNYPFKKPIVQLNLNNELVNVFESAAFAARINGFCKAKIGSCCLKKRPTHMKFKWLFLSDYQLLR